MRIAEEIERRSVNRLAEVAEVLAHHYSQTGRPDKAFTYLAMAAAKSVGVYSLDEASDYLAAAIALLDKRSDCASDWQVAELLVNYTLYSNLRARYTAVVEVVARFRSRIDRLGDVDKRVLIYHHYVYALIFIGQFREAQETEAVLSAMATRMKDDKSTAYAIAIAIHISTIITPHRIEAFEKLSREAINAASNVDDPYLQAFVRFVVAWDEFHRGRMTKATEEAVELLNVGQLMNDTRSIGYAMALNAWIALTADDYKAALHFAETGTSTARTSYDRMLSKNANISALVLLKRPDVTPMLREWMDECEANSWYGFLVGAEGTWGIALVIGGNIGSGIKWLEQAVLKREREGYRTAADWYRTFLCEIYLEIISGTEKPPAKVLARNALTLVAVMFTARKRISALVARVRQNPQLDPNGHHVGRCEMILGLLYKVKKKRSLAVQHLTEAKRIISQFGPSPMLTKIETALAEVA